MPYTLKVEGEIPWNNRFNNYQFWWADRKLADQYVRLHIEGFNDPKYPFITLPPHPDADMEVVEIIDA